MGDQIKNMTEVLCCVYTLNKEHNKRRTVAIIKVILINIYWIKRLLNSNIFLLNFLKTSLSNLLQPIFQKLKNTIKKIN